MFLDINGIVPLCGTGSGRAVLGKPVVQSKRRHPRVPSLIREGSDRLERGRRFGAKKKPGAQPGSRPLPVAGAVSFDCKLYGITKREGACVGEPQVPATHGAKRKSPPQQAPKEKGTFRCPFSFGAEDGTRTHTPKYWLLRPERLPFRHFRLFHFGPAHSQNSRPTSTRIIPFLALPCQFPGLSPPFGGCLSTGVVLG